MRRRLRALSGRRLPASPRRPVPGELSRRPELIALAVIVLAGLALRVLFIVSWRPGLVGFPDSPIYIQDAISGIFSGPLRVGGYAEFLRIVHGVLPHLWFAVAVQHVLGLLSGLLLFAAVRRAGLPAGLGLVPAAVVILGGSELFVEHAVLTEAVFIFLVDLGLYGLVRGWREHPAWFALAGLALGASADVRTVGLILLAVLAAATLLIVPGSWRQRVGRTALLVVFAAVPVGGFLKAHEDAVGYGGFTGAGYFDLYARVAPFVECSRFDPPAGTARLCITVPRSRREGHDVWEFTPASPAVKLFGEPDKAVPQPGENAKLRAFAEAAVEAQPLDYLEAVGRDLVRIVDPSFASSAYVGNRGYGSPPAGLAGYYFNTRDRGTVRGLLARYYPGEREEHSSVTFLRGYEAATRVEGPLMALLLLLAAVGPLLAVGSGRVAASLFLLAAATLLVVPVLISEYDYRFTIPAFGPLAAAAAIGGYAATRRLLRWRRRGRARLSAPASPP